MKMTTAGLEDAYNLLNLGLENRKSFDKYFVFTGTSAATELAGRISIDKEPSKNLLTGIKGCGKTTEMLRLLRELEDNYFGVYIPIRADAEVRKITAPDILVSGLLHLYISCGERNVVLSEAMIKDLGNWLQETFVALKLAFDERHHEQKALEERIKRAISVLKAQRVRDAVQGSLEERKSELVERLDKLITEIEAATKKKVMLAFDDLDKLPLERAKTLFAENGDLLTSPNCKMVLTVPYSLIHTHDFREISRLFKKYVNQGPAVVSGKDSKEGTCEMRDIVAKRISLDLIEDEALDALIAKTGGIVADLLRCASECCIRARTDGKQKIDTEVMNAVLDDIRKDSSRTLGLTDCNILSTIYKSKMADNNDAFLRLLDDGYILEYVGEEGNYYVHPFIIPVLKDRKLI